MTFMNYRYNLMDTLRVDATIITILYWGNFKVDVRLNEATLQNRICMRSE